jgi:hypothetical protein
MPPGAHCCGEMPVLEVTAQGRTMSAARAAEPSHLATLRTTAAPGCAGPAFEPGTVEVQQLNYRASGGPLPGAPAPGQPAFHVAPSRPGSR